MTELVSYLWLVIPASPRCLLWHDSVHDVDTVTLNGSIMFNDNDWHSFIAQRIIVASVLLTEVGTYNQNCLVYMQY